MSPDDADATARWADAERAGDLFAVDPVGLGGVVLRAQPGPARDRWIERNRSRMPPGTPMRRIPAGIRDDRFVGGLDLSATLAAGRPVVQRGVLAEAAGGVVVLPMAERWTTGGAARLGLVMDRGEVLLERDGLSDRIATRFGVIAFDEGLENDERPPASLTDRLALHVDLSAIPARLLDAAPVEAARCVAQARDRLSRVRLGSERLRTLCEVAQALGIESMRAPLFAARAARAAAALAGRDEVGDEDVVLAARLVLAPRATRLPMADLEPETQPEAAERPQPESADADPGLEIESRPEDDREAPEGPVRESTPDRVLDAITAAIPSDLLEQFSLDVASTSIPASAGGRRGAKRSSRRRGRPIGVEKGDPGAGARLSLIETLRAAAPWQPLRRRSAPTDRPAVALHVRRDDFRITRFQEVAETTAIFAVDASGSTALQRLAETKGAIELLLAQSYVRRDRVALIAFRGTTAELLLPPTRSLLAAKRRLAALPGGGGTPLAAGMMAARDLAGRVLSSGGVPLVIFLTDGQANIALDGSPGRERAMGDAIRAARALRAARVKILLVDTSPRERSVAREIAVELGGRYLWLPRARSSQIADRVRDVRSERPRMPNGGARSPMSGG